MVVARRSRWQVALATVMIAGIVLILARVVTHPEIVTDRLFRLGARFVGGIVQRPGAFGAWFAVGVLCMWLVIGLQCLREGKQGTTR